MRVSKPEPGQTPEEGTGPADETGDLAPGGTVEAPPRSYWTAREERLALQSWVLGATARGIFVGSFVIYYLKELGISDRLLGLATALPSLATLAQFAGSVWLERTANRRRLVVGRFLLQPICWVPVVVIGWQLAGQPARYPLAIYTLIFCSSLGALCLHLGNPAWDSWFADAVSDRRKGAFFGTFGILTRVLMGAVGIGGGLLVDRLSGGSPVLYLRLLLSLFAVAILMSVVSWQRILPLRDFPMERPARTDLRSLLRMVIHERNYLRFLGMYACYAFANGLFTTFAVAWFEEDLRLSLTFLGWLSVVSTVCFAGTSRFWGELATRFGGRPTVWLGYPSGVLLPLSYFLYTRENVFWLAPLTTAVLSAWSAGFVVGVNTLWYTLPGPKARSMQFAVAYGLLGIAGTLAPLLAGSLTGHLGALRLAGWEGSRYHWLFLFGAVAQGVTGLMLARVRESRGRSARLVLAWLWKHRREMLPRHKA